MRPPKIPSLFKLGKHRDPKQFDFKPRVYDERKEKLEKRKREIESELSEKPGVGPAYEDHLRERISSNWHRTQMRRDSRKSSFRLVIILAILVLIVYFIYLKM